MAQHLPCNKGGRRMRAQRRQLTAVSVGGGVSRENFGTRILGRYTVSHWKMLAAEVERMPSCSKHRGWVQIVTGPEAGRRPRSGTAI